MDVLTQNVQVHVAHNVVIGRACLIAAQCGIAGKHTQVRKLIYR
jgi:UDP-3-O-[3-hydroxymyristoyl] glucosamine N-acyltransferase